jgi:hypothetical protein
MMVEVRTRPILRTIPFLIAVCFVALTAQGKYSGGSGTAQDPYQIVTAADLILLGETPGDDDKHFILTTDVDLDPKLPSRKVFDKAVIAPDTNDTQSGFQGTSFTGVFDGDGHTISHLTVEGTGYVGLFGRLGFGGVVKNLSLPDVTIAGSGNYVGGLVGYNETGTVTQCYSTGAIKGKDYVGGLVGGNAGTVARGLVREDFHSTVADCYSTGTVSGGSTVGGLIGANSHTVTHCYSTGAVSGTGDDVGGLVGSNDSGTVTDSFWDTETSGQETSGGGTGKTTAPMKDDATFTDLDTPGLSAPVWDFVGNPHDDEGNNETWSLNAAVNGGYPYLNANHPPEYVFDIYDLQAMERNLAGNYIVVKDIDASPCNPNSPNWDSDEWPGTGGFRSIGLGKPWFTGSLDGQGHTITGLHMNWPDGEANWAVGLLADIEDGVVIQNVHLADVDITAGGMVGALVGGAYGATYTITNCSSSGVVNGDSVVGGLLGYNDIGTITDCHSAGTVSGNDRIGGLVYGNYGTVSRCFSTCSVICSGGEYVGGLVGANHNIITESYATGSVSTSSSYVGGLVGEMWDGDILDCYSTGSVTGIDAVGGLIGSSYRNITNCYSTGAVSATTNVGGLVGYKAAGTVTDSFWDAQTSGKVTSAGGTGKTTAEMKTAKTFLEADWDFVGETANGTEDIWWILEGKGYPRSWWELIPEN